MRKYSLMYHLRFTHVILLSLFSFVACKSTEPILDATIISIEESKYEQILSKLPNYSSSLYAVKGNGRAIVSEPGNSERASIEFETDSLLSLLTIKNRIGIIGGKMLVDKDSILIYSKIDKVAQKVSIKNGNLTSLNELASVNLLDLLNFKIDIDQVAEIQKHFMNEEVTVIIFKNNGYASVSEKSGMITYVEQPPSSGLPYSAIRYENYSNLDGYILPRKITILSADETSKVIFQIRSLELNPNSLNLIIDIPNDISIQRI